MNNLADMIWIELRKAIRSRMPLWTALGSLFMPFGIAFLIFVAKNPEISQKLGLVSAKANLIAYSATDWPTYLGLSGQIIAAGGFFLFVLVISWVFGREFADGTLKDMLAVPVQRSSILLAKFIVVAVWSAALTIVIFIVGLVMGALIRLPGGSISCYSAGQRPRAGHRLPGDCGRAAVRVLCQRGAGLPAAHGRGGSDADDGQPGDGRRLGRILPLGRAGSLCAGKRRPAPGQPAERVR